MTLVLLVSGAPVAGLQTPADADRLYADRENLASAREASAIWERQLDANPRDVEAAWKVARAAYWLGGHSPRSEQRARYERGVEAARRAVELEPKRPEGHFWMAANMGALAESFGLRAGLRYRGAIKRELETVLALDPSFLRGSADRALGRWYLMVPRLFGGSRARSVEHLQKSLEYDRDSVASHFFLAETYFAMDRDEDARRELRLVLDAPLEEGFEPESREFKARARALLAARR
jgi:tetratricopeptide (TPR) repeat protein